MTSLVLNNRALGSESLTKLLVKDLLSLLEHIQQGCGRKVRDAWLWLYQPLTRKLSVIQEGYLF